MSRYLGISAELPARVCVCVCVSQQDCEYDAVEIRSGLDQQSRLHGTYCGSQPPQPVTSESNALRITFTSDNTVQKSGFSAFFFTGRDGHSSIHLPTGYRLIADTVVERRPLAGELSLTESSRCVTTVVGKPSATGQPTRPTQPFILSGSINRVPSLIGWGKGGNVTSCGWQVTLAGTWVPVAPRRLRTACYTPLPLLYMCALITRK